MGQDRKKQAKLLANRHKQKKFTAKYGNYTPSKKIIINEPQTNKEEREVTEANNEEVLSSVNTTNTENIEPKYETKESSPVITEIENENVKSHKVDIPNFYNRWYKRLGNDTLKQEVRSGMFAILRDAGYKTNNAIPLGLVNNIYSRVSEIQSWDPNTDARSADMKDIATLFFRESYSSIEKTGLSPESKVMAAQKIADLMLKSYSPVAFANGELDQYADNYVVQNKALLKDQLEKLNVQNVDKLIEDVDVELARATENKQPEQPVASDEERKEREIAFAKQGLEELSQHRGGLTEDKRDRENLRAYYQGILDKYKTDEEWYNESLAQAEQKRQEQRERDAREKELKEQAENSGIRDIIEDEANRDAIAGEENDTNLPTDENPKQEAIYIPDFYDRLNERFDNNDVTKLVMSELKAIIKSAGIEDQQTASDIAELVYFNVAEGLKTSYVEGGFRPKTRDAVESCFDNADYALNLRDDIGLNLEERLVAAQRITNVMFKNYSPVTFADHKLDYYAEDYVLKDDELLRKQLSDHYKISQDQIEPMMQNIRAKLEGRTVNKQAEPDAVLNPEVKENNAQEMAPKQEPAPKQNAQVQNTMDDFFGADDLIDGSKPDAFERKLAEQKAKEEQEKKAQEEKVQGQPTIVNAFEDDDFIVGDKPDAFERKLAEQEAKEAVKKEAEKKAAEEAAKKAAKEAQKLEEAKQRENSVRANVFINNLKTFNGMYKVNLEPNNFALTVSDAWTLIRSGDDKKKADGQKMLGELFKSAIKPAFEIEKHASYNEHRLPDYTEIAKSANELLRSAMYGFTDMYHSPNTKDLFEATAFGGLNAKDIVALTEGESQWSMDQKSDEAWEIQSKDAKNLADKWLSGDKPYEKMISEMKALVKADKDGIVDRKEILTKLTAAEWLLVNNDKMMIDDPEDPLNKLPNWGNRYWKALTEAREALGIDKHTSMRDLIQSDYAASAKAVISSAYNEAQIEDYVLDSAAREIYDSMEIQKEQFATQSAAVTLTDSQIDKNAEEIEMTGVRFPHPVPELDERTIMQHQPKNYDFVIEPQTELNLTAKNQTQAK